MSDQLFQENPTQNNPQETPEQSPSSNSPDALFADQLQQIKNEKGEPKYADPQTALEALKHSQEYIPQLKSQLEEKDRLLQEAMAKLEASKKVEDLLQGQAPQAEQQSTPAEPQADVGNLDELINKALVERELKAQQDSNYRQVTEALNAKFGAQANAEIIKKAQELGTTVERLKQIAHESPQMVLAHFSANTPTPAPLTGGRQIPAKAPEFELPKPTKSLLSGAKASEQADHMASIRKAIWAKHGITG